jgi:hypothetical protein
MPLAIDVNGNNVSIRGPESALEKAEPLLVPGGKLVVEAREGEKGARIVADPAAQYQAVLSGLEWLRRQQVADPHAAAVRDIALNTQRATERKLLELDLQAAELELQAATEDLERYQQLGAAVSQQELRAAQRAVDRAKIQVARIKVQLEAVSDPQSKAGN